MLIKEYNNQSKTVFGIECKKLLYKKKTNYQEIKIYSSELYGNIMMLDGCFMVTEYGNDQYHDKCVELCYKKSKELDILIIGGGDFGLVKNLFKSIKIKKLHLVEIDGKVIDISMKYFPDFFNMKKKEKEKIVITIDDGYKWLIKNKEFKFDIIIVDCTDPNILAKKLYSTKFYKSINKSLKKSGFMVQQSGSIILDQKKIIEPTVSKLKKVGFSNITVNPFHMPIYPLGLWSFIKCKKQS